MVKDDTKGPFPRRIKITHRRSIVCSSPPPSACLFVPLAFIMTDYQFGSTYFSRLWCKSRLLLPLPLGRVRCVLKGIYQNNQCVFANFYQWLCWPLFAHSEGTLMEKGKVILRGITHLHIS